MISISNVYFAKTNLSTNQVGEGSLIIWPTKDTWNDFGYRTLFNFSITGERVTGRVRLGFLHPDESPVMILRQVLEKSEVDFLPASAFPTFFSLQVSNDAYKELINEFGGDNIRNILLMLNDLAIIRHMPQIPDWFEAAIKTKVFTLSFMRTSDSFLAYHNAYLLFTRPGQVQVTSPLRYLAYTFQLDGFKNPHELEFFFTHEGLLPKRISILIGRNGVGKSRSLYEISNAFLTAKESLYGEEGRYPRISRLITVSTPGETENTFPPIPSVPLHVDYIRLSALSNNFGEPLPIVLQKLFRMTHASERDFRWDNFRRAIEPMLDIGSLGVRTRRPAVPSNNDVFVSLDELTYGGEQSALEASQRLDPNGELMREIQGVLLPLSSGQLSFVRMAAQLCLHIEEGSLILIDEPETHLHPNMVSDFVSMLNRILEVTNSVAILATHSAYLVREVPSSQIQIIEVSDRGNVLINTPRLKTFGANVGSISNFIFGDGVINRFADEVRSRIASAMEDEAQHWRRELEEDLSTEAVMYLKSKDLQ